MDNLFLALLTLMHPVLLVRVVRKETGRIPYYYNLDYPKRFLDMQPIVSTSNCHQCILAGLVAVLAFLACQVRQADASVIP